MKISIPGPQTQTPQRVHFSSIFFISPTQNLIHKRNLSPLSLSPSLLYDSPFLFISSRSNSFFFYPLPSSFLPLSIFPLPLPTAKSAVPFLLPYLPTPFSPSLSLSTISIPPRALLLVAGRLSPPLGVRPRPDASRRPRGASRRAPAAGLRPSRRFLRRRRRRRSAGGSESA